jgi:hypothetical protein
MFIAKAKSIQPIVALLLILALPGVNAFIVNNLS